MAAAAGGGGGAVKFLEARLLVSAFLAMGTMEFSLVLYGDSLFDAHADSATRAIQSIGEEEFLARATALAEQYVRPGLPLRGEIQLFGYIGTKR